MSLGPDDIDVTVFDVTPELEAVVEPVSTVSVVTQPPDIFIVGAAPLGPQGPPGTVGPFYAGHTYAVLGDLGGVITLPSFFVPKHANQTVKLAGIFADVERGTIKLQIKRNGTDIGPLLTLGQTAVWTPLGGVVLAHGDKISAVLSNPVNAPATLSATVTLEWSVP